MGIPGALLRRDSLVPRHGSWLLAEVVEHLLLWNCTLRSLLHLSLRRTSTATTALHAHHVREVEVIHGAVDAAVPSNEGLSVTHLSWGASRG